MVGRWGMSDGVGPVTVLLGPGQESPLGLDGVAPATKELVDREVRRIVDECHDQAVATLRAHRDQLDRLAHALFTHETLDEDAAYTAAGVPRTTAPAAPAHGDVPDVPRQPGTPSNPPTDASAPPLAGTQVPSTTAPPA
jgi:cell division protease FtsH